MSWLPKWLGERYGKLYAQFGEEVFDFAQARGALGTTDETLLNVLSQLRRYNYLCVFGRDNRRRLYRLFSPESVVLASQVGVENFNRFKQGAYSHLLVKLVLELHKKYREGLVSVVVFGSVARGTARADSDVDVLIITDGFRGSLASRFDRLLEVEHKTCVGDELRWLWRRNLWADISFYPLTPDEARHFRLLFLDIVADGITLFDKGGFFESLRVKFKHMLGRMEAERVFVSENDWFWVMNPEAELGVAET